MKQEINNMLRDSFLGFRLHTKISNILLFKFEEQFDDQLGIEVWGQIDNDLCKEIEGFQHVAGN